MATDGNTHSSEKQAPERQSKVFVPLGKPDPKSLNEFKLQC